MKRIKLTQGQFAIVDDADFEWLNQWRWFAHKDRVIFYAARRVRLSSGKQTTFLMHREIQGLKFGDKREIDHRNHNGLDNRRCNLRICTHSQNTRYQRPRKGCTSQYKGVYLQKICSKWHAQIVINGHRKYLGLFTSDTEAALAYDRKAKELFGEFACLNFQQIENIATEAAQIVTGG